MRNLDKTIRNTDIKGRHICIDVLYSYLIYCILCIQPRPPSPKKESKKKSVKFIRIIYMPYQEVGGKGSCEKRSKSTTILKAREFIIAIYLV